MKDSKVVSAPFVVILKIVPSELVPPTTVVP